MKEKQTILLVDDSKDDLMLMHAAFSMANSNLLLQEAGNGEEAVAYLKGEGQYGDRNKFPLPTIMLLDLNMPKMDGFDVLAWVRAQPVFKHLNIIILSASMRSKDMERIFDLGATSYLVKPSNLQTLAAMMRCLCDWVHMNHFPPLHEAGGK